MAGFDQPPMPSSFDVGNPNAGHTHIDANGMKLYGPDGTTLLFNFDAVAGTVNIVGRVSIATQADNATNAANATNATNAANATNATNLAGGGTASGSTTINGQLIVGNVAGSHVVVGTDANGANGVRLYGADGVTPLIDLNITGTPRITATEYRTASNLAVGGAVAGIAIAATNWGQITFYHPTAGETIAANIHAAGVSQLGISSGASSTNPNASFILLDANPAVGAQVLGQGQVQLMVSGKGTVTSDGSTLTTDAGMSMRSDKFYLRTGTDTNHYIGYDSTVPDGPTIWGWDGVKFGTNDGGAVIRASINNAGLMTADSFLPTGQPGRGVNINAAVSIAASTVTGITWNQTPYTSGNNQPTFSGSTVTIPREGWYLVSLRAVLASSVGSSRTFIQIRRLTSGTGEPGQFRAPLEQGGIGTVAGLTYFTAGSQIVCEIYQATAAAINLSQAQLDLIYIRPGA